jgi:hypothetical protein
VGEVAVAARGQEYGAEQMRLRVALHGDSSERKRLMKVNRRFWILVLLACAAGCVNVWDIGGVSRLRSVLVVLLGGAFFVTVYAASRATSLRPFRMVVNGAAGLICGCLCAVLLGREAVEVGVYGLVGVLIGVGSDVWLSRF